MGKFSILRLLSAVSTGVIFAACFPGFGEIGELVWIGLIPLLAGLWTIQGGKERWKLFWLGLLAGFCFFMINLKWLWTVSGLGAMALSVYLALFWGVWAIFVGKVANPWSRERQEGAKKGILAQGLWSLRFSSLIGISWVAQEWLRGWLFTGFGWNGLGVSFAQTPVIAQAADIVGVTGMSFFPAFFAAVILQVILRMRDELGKGRLATRLDFGVAVLVVAVLFAYGVWRIDAMQRQESRPVSILLMQQNIPQSLKWEPGESDRIYTLYNEGLKDAFNKMAQTNEERMKQAKEDEVFHLQDPELVIWPESAVSEPLFFDVAEDQFWGFRNGNYFLQDIMPQGEFILLTGINNREVEEQEGGFVLKEGGRIYNSIVAVDSDSSVQGVYRKNHLVPFGEYIPLREQIPLLEWFFKFSAGQDFGGNFSSGGVYDPMNLSLRSGDLSIIPSVCFEDTVGRLTRKFVRDEAQLIVNVTNDGWFLESEAARQQLANAMFRSIELRRPTARAANTGVSAMIDTTGSLQIVKNGEVIRRVIEDSESGSHFVKGHLYAQLEIPLQPETTIYARIGDAFSWICVFLTLVLAVLAKKRRKAA